MPRLHRALLALVLAFLAACGGAGGSSGGTASGAGSAAGTEQERVVQHAMGETAVPANPERVVVLDTQELDAAVSLGITPVGAVRTDVGTDFPSYLRDVVEQTQNVGTIQTPDLEAIAALEPDLILSSKLRHEAIYADLAQIAPTVFAERTGDAWKDNLLLYARALGKEQEAERTLAEYERRATELGEQLGNPRETTVSVVRFLPGEIRLYGPKSFSGTVLEDVGLARPQVVMETDEIAVNVSLEQLGQADADVIYVTTYGPEQDTQQREALAGPLWNSLEAVRNGRVHQVADDIWMLGIGVTGANLILDDLQKTLLPAAAAG